MMKRKNNYLVQRYKLAKKRFEKFSERFEKALERGVSRQELHFFNLRLSRLGKKLARFEQKLKLGVASLAFGGLMLGGNIEAEAQTRIPAFEPSIANPFGFTNIGTPLVTIVTPSFVDIDDDGDVDAFLGESEYGNIKYYENTGDNSNPAFATAVDNPFGLMNLGIQSFPSPSFVDIDRDGDLDAFFGELSGSIRYFENTGDSENPAFAAVLDNPFGFTDVGRMSSPAFLDIDGDGDLDALVGEELGNIKFFENSGDVENPAFNTVSDNPFGMSDIGKNARVNFADLDQDGDFDVFVGELYGDIKFFENTGDRNSPAFVTTIDNPFGFTNTVFYSCPAFSDIDGDGDLDTFIGGGLSNINYFENTGIKTGFVFDEPVLNPFGFTDEGSNASPAFVDLDADGDLDVIVGDAGSKIFYFENTGSAINPVFTAPVENPFGFTNVGGAFYNPVLKDLDADGDFDLLITRGVDGDVNYYENTGTAKSPLFSAPLSNPFGFSTINLSGGGFFGFTQLVLEDLDSDGDLDALASDSGVLMYLENTGSATAPSFIVISNTNPFNMSVSISKDAINLIDIDNDGDLDFFNCESDGDIFFQENTGNATSPAFSSKVSIPFGLESSTTNSVLSFADLDIDGDLDLFLGEQNGNIYFFENKRMMTWESADWDFNEPNKKDFATIADDYNTSTNGDITANDLTINTTFTLTISDGDSVEIAGDLVNSGSITVESGGSLIQTSASPSNSGTGTYTVERLGSDYHGIYNYWSSPVVNTTINDVFGSTGRRFYSFNGTSQAWENADKNASLAGGFGFTATGTSNTPTTITRSFTSTSGFHSGDITQALVYDGVFDADKNWHLVGNPYPSGLDVDGFITDNTAMIENAIYLWSSDGSDYVAVGTDYATMGLAGVVTAGGSTIAPGSATVASCQGFFVQAKQTGNITFSNSQRIATNNTFLRSNKNNWERIWLGVAHENGAKNEILLAFIPEAEEGKDLYDASKFSGNDFVSFYSLGECKGVACYASTKWAIQGLPSLIEDKVVPLGIEAKEAGEFVFSLNHLDNFPADMQILLHDGENNSLTDMRTDAYKVNLEKGAFNERFSLRFIDAKVTSIEDDLALTGISLYSTGKQVNISFADLQSAEASIAVYDLQGRQLFAQSTEGQNQISFEMPESGIYIVKVENAKGLVTKRLFVE